MDSSSINLRVEAIESKIATQTRTALERFKQKQKPEKPWVYKGKEVGTDMPSYMQRKTLLYIRTQ